MIEENVPKNRKQRRKFKVEADLRQKGRPRFEVSPREVLEEEAEYQQQIRVRVSVKDSTNNEIYSKQNIIPKEEIIMTTENLNTESIVNTKSAESPADETAHKETIMSERLHLSESFVAVGKLPLTTADRRRYDRWSVMRDKAVKDNNLQMVEIAEEMVRVIAEKYAAPGEKDATVKTDEVKKEAEAPKGETTKKEAEAPKAATPAPADKKEEGFFKRNWAKAKGFASDHKVACGIVGVAIAAVVYTAVTGETPAVEDVPTEA